MRVMRVRLLALVALAVIGAAGCNRKHPAPAPQPVLRAWPQGHTSPFKITDSLTLEIPLQYWRFAISPVTPPRVPVLQHSDRFEVQFDFFLPDFSGYTLQNYRNDSDENKVEVAYLHAGDMHEADPDAPGAYPPNMLKRSLRESLNANDYKDMYGLRCYTGRVLTDRLACYGRRDEKNGEDILLSVPVPPYAPGGTFPMIQARYFSLQYGGVRLAWRTHVKNLPRWHDIDAQIWKFIDAWKVAPAPAAAAPANATASPSPAASPGEAAPMPPSHPPPAPPSHPPPAPSPRSQTNRSDPTS